MTIILKSFFRLGILLSYVGVIAGFLVTSDAIFGYILLGCAILYLLQAMWSANHPSEYNNFSQCFHDIMGDLAAYSLLLILIFGWFITSRFIHIPISDLRYWIVVAFLMSMCLITLIEMIITIRSCLVALERQNPISIVR